MSRYVISDHHLGHSRIIGYTDRPFTSVGEMNQTLLNRHYETVGKSDTLLRLGDVAMDTRDGEETIEFLDQPGGDLLIRGNHDTGLAAEDAPFPLSGNCTIEHDGRASFRTHRPEDVPAAWDGWTIHGHEHDNHPEEFPFVAYDDRRVDVSCEPVNDRPIAVETLCGVLDACPEGSRIRDVDVARTERGGEGADVGPE